MQINKEFESLFNRSCSSFPTWVCIVLTVLVLTSATLVWTDLAGVSDFVLQTEKREVPDVDLESVLSDNSILLQLGNKTLKRGENGTISYYMYTYPFYCVLGVRESVETLTNMVLDYKTEIDSITTEEAKQAYIEEKQEKVLAEAEHIKEKDSLRVDAVGMYIVAFIFYKIASFILLFKLLEIPTGLITKIQYRHLTKKIRWVF